MSIKEMWHNGAKRLLLVLIGISAAILFVVGGVATGIIYLTIRLDTVADKQQVMVDQVADNVASITSLTDSVNEGWDTFQKNAPTYPVPQITDVPLTDPTAGKTEIVIKPPISKAKPTQTPKVRTVIKYKSRPKPTPQPIFRWKK